MNRLRDLVPDVAFIVSLVLFVLGFALGTTFSVSACFMLVMAIWLERSGK